MRCSLLESRPSYSEVASKDPINGLSLFIQATLTPDDWESLGGPNTLVPLSSRRVIGIYAPLAVQKQIKQLLNPKVFAAEYERYLDNLKAEQLEWKRILEKANIETISSFAEKLDTKLTPLTKELKLEGIWQIYNQYPPQGSPIVTYRIIDGNTLEAKSLVDGETKPVDLNYAVDFGQLHVSNPNAGIAHQALLASAFCSAAFTEDGELLLFEWGTNIIVNTYTAKKAAITGE